MSVASSLHVKPDFDDLDFEDVELRADLLKNLKEKLHRSPVQAREVLQNFNPNVDRFQKKVIQAKEKTIRLIAPAGSGKTQTVVNRMLERMRNGLKPERILALTFDNNAAGSLREKMAFEFSKLGASLDGVQVSTLNAFGYGLLKKYWPDEYKPVASVHRQIGVLEEIREQLYAKSQERAASLPNNINRTFFLEFFSLLKNRVFDPRTIGSQAFADFFMVCPLVAPFVPDPEHEDHIKLVIQAIHWLFRAYELGMSKSNCLDFDDQKLRPYVLFRDSPKSCSSLQASFEEIIVDEFQDINELDFEFIKLLSAKSNLVVTGDDDQAIYGFRGCSPEYIINLEEHLGRPVKEYQLSINYRCPPNIVEHSDRLIRHNKVRITKNPTPNLKRPSTITVLHAVSASLEAKLILDLISRIRAANPTVNLNDFAILYRTNAQSLPIQMELILGNLPYLVRERDNILKSESIERFLGVMRVKLALDQGRQPTVDDQVSTIDAYFRYVSNRDQEKLRQLFTYKKDFLGVISSHAFAEVLPKSKKSHYEKYMLETLRCPNLHRTVDSITRHFNGLRGAVAGLEDVLTQQAPLGEILDIACSFRGTLGEFVTMWEKALRTARESRAGHDKEGVHLLTYFKCKGLQFHTVFLTTCNEGLIPHSKAPIEDERRLFYVAMTRPTANLVITYLKKVCGTTVGASRFLQEAGLI